MERVSLKEKLGYGLGDTASNVVFQVVIAFLLYFYTDVFGISAAAAGTMFLVVRIFDAFTDPIMGGIADRTNTRWGRYRPYLIWIAIPYAILAVLAFTTPDFDESGKLIYAYITYTLLMTAYTAINIPYSALGGVMSSSTEERASIQSFRFGLALAGGALVTWSVLPLVGFFGEGDEQKGFQMAMVVLSIVAVACFFACFAMTKERITSSHSAGSTLVSGVSRDVKKLFKNDQWCIIALITLVLLTSVVMRGSTTAYYVQYYLGEESKITLFLTAGMMAGVVGALSTNWLVKLTDKVTLMKITTIGIIVTNSVLFLIPSDAVYLALVFVILVNFVHMVFTPLLFAAVPDTVDYGVKKFGSSAMAMAFSGHLFALKIGLALGGAFTGWILAYSGYQANMVQSEAALDGILFSHTVASVIAGVVVLICLKFYKLDGKEEAKA